jgi:cytochrome c oxidase assembly protein subunit 11
MRRGKYATVLLALGILGTMGVLTTYSVSLYEWFCRVTGYGGTTQVAEATGAAVLDRTITVRFNADTNPALPWSFRPAQRAVEVRVGESSVAHYRADSVSDAPSSGTATYNVTPMKVGKYFVKIQCFCFTEQTLASGEGIDMPVQFYIDPRIAEDRDMDDVTTITLSYTFFPMPASASGRDTKRTTLNDTDARAPARQSVN